MSLARCFERFFFINKTMLCLEKLAKTNAFSAIGKMKADKTDKSFPTYQILAFEVSSVGYKLSNIGSENSIGWRKFSIIISFILPIAKSVCFSSFYEAKHLKETLKINAPN